MVYVATHPPDAVVGGRLVVGAVVVGGRLVVGAAVVGGRDVVSTALVAGRQRREEHPLAYHAHLESRASMVRGP
jgi:hypothetical protein